MIFTVFWVLFFSVFYFTFWEGPLSTAPATRGVPEPLLVLCTRGHACTGAASSRFDAAVVDSSERGIG